MFTRSFLMTREDSYDLKLSENYRIQNFVCILISTMLKNLLGKRQGKYTKIGSWI